MSDLPPDLNDILLRICEANENFLAVDTDAARRTQIVAQLDALIDLAAKFRVGAHLAPTRRAIHAIAALNLESRDPILSYEGKKRPATPPADTGIRSWLAAAAEWFVRAGEDEEHAARAAVHEARVTVKWQQVKKWRQQYSGARETKAHALATDRFRRLTSEMPPGCGNAQEAAVRLARAAPNITR